MLAVIQEFFSNPPKEAGPIYNERSLQLEMAYYFRLKGLDVQFERSFQASRISGSTKDPKKNLDLLVQFGGSKTAIELKVPLSGRHPETLYDFCADIEYVESIIRDRKVDRGFCILMTNDSAFWKDSGRGSRVHNVFRCEGDFLTGMVTKPTGNKDSCVVVTGTYEPARLWKPVGDGKLMAGANYLLIEVKPQ